MSSFVEEISPPYHVWSSMKIPGGGFFSHPWIKGRGEPSAHAHVGSGTQDSDVESFPFISPLPMEAIRQVVICWSVPTLAKRQAVAAGKDSFVIKTKKGGALSLPLSQWQNKHQHDWATGVVLLGLRTGRESAGNIALGLSPTSKSRTMSGTAVPSWLTTATGHTGYLHPLHTKLPLAFCEGVFPLPGNSLILANPRGSETPLQIPGCRTQRSEDLASLLACAAVTRG